VLVCDDEQQIVRAVRVILHEGGYDVSEAATLAEALEVAARRTPDAAIVDLVLPDGDGVQLCRELRSWSMMPIVVLSALLTEVWGADSAGDTTLLRTHIANLRHKIERAGAARQSLISTEPGVGYRFGP
jgi:DNA-binding response OmpR family regulator